MFNPDNAWRRVASAVYQKPKDSRIMGSVELDITDLEKYVQTLRADGIRVSYTHYFALAIAKALCECVPEFNTYVRRGKVLIRETIDVSISVLSNDGKQMDAITIRSADKLSLQDFTQLANQHISASKNSDDGRKKKAQKMLANIPWPLRGLFFRLIKFLTLELGFSSNTLGLKPNQYGSFVVSNIGSIGLDIGYPALLPASNVSAVFTLGIVETLPRYKDELVVPRRILKMGATMDHRVVDGVHGGRLFKYLKKMVENPKLIDENIASTENLI